MPSEVRVVGQKFFAKLNNGDSYSINPSDFSRHLKGGVSEEVKAVFNVQVEWYVVMSRYNLLYDSGAATLRIEKSGLDFKDNGFSVGDSVKLSQNGSNPKLSGDVTSLSIGEMVLENVTINSGSIISGYYTNIVGGDPLTGTTPLTALNYKFGLIENDEPFNTLSKLTNTEQGYLVDGINHGAPLTFANGLSQGNNKAWVTGSLSCAFVGLSADKDYNLNQNTTQEFQIEHTFVINPSYRDGELDSLKGIDVPPDDIFEGYKSLKYVFQTEFRSTLNNPNTSKIFDYDTQLGSVGYYGESYNGFPNNYSTDALSYAIGGNSVNKISIGEVTSISFDIISSNSTFTASTPVVVGHISIINSLSYSNSPNDYNTQWTNESIRTITGDAPKNGGLIKNYTATFVSSSKISILFDVEFTSNQSKSLNDGQDYIIYYTVANPILTVDSGDKVTNLADVNVYDKNGDISGLFDVDVLDQYPLPYEFEKGVTTGFTHGKMFIEDEQMCYARFKILNTYLGEDLDLLEDVNLESLNFKIVAYNTVTNTWFDLRSLNIDLSNEVLAGNIQNIELDSTRGYVLADDDIFNSLTLTTDTNDGTWQYYDLQVGYKIPWQQWLELLDADKIFYDKTKSQNNLNQSAATYSFDNNYVIKFLIEGNVETTGVSTNYVKRTGDFLAYDYNTDDQDPSEFTCKINTYKEDGEPILNKVIEKKFTELRAVFTPLTPPVFSSSVDFTEVANDWNKYAHGNLYLPSLFPGDRLGVWANDQANDTDTFSDNINDFTKNAAGLYTSTTSSIETNQNCFAVYGCYSIDKYEFYEITGTMFSLATDNDTIVYDICFIVDDLGIEHTLSLCTTTGGIPSKLNPTWVDGDVETSTIGFENVPANWSLVYDFGKRECINIDQFDTTKAGLNWNSGAVGDFYFNISRAASDITINGNWTIDGVTFTNQMSYNLNDNEITKKFKGFCNIGFAFMSQDQGGFKDVVLTNPIGDFYAALRIEPENGSSDSGISELNTEVDNTEDSLLKQSSGNENRALLSFDGNDFVVQGLIDTDNIVDGEKYKFSAELRQRNLIV